MPKLVPHHNLIRAPSPILVLFLVQAIGHPLRNVLQIAVWNTTPFNKNGKSRKLLPTGVLNVPRSVILIARPQILAPFLVLSNGIMLRVRPIVVMMAPINGIP